MRRPGCPGRIIWRPGQINLAAIPPLYCRIVAALHIHERVHICVNDAAAAEQVQGLLQQAGD